MLLLPMMMVAVRGAAAVLVKRQPNANLNVHVKRAPLTVLAGAGASGWWT
jgi:hypothetical protein